MARWLSVSAVLLIAASYGAQGSVTHSLKWLHPTPTSGHIYAMSWFTPTHGIIVTSLGDILRTTDGGQSFTICQISSSGVTSRNDIFFLNEEIGWIVGKYGSFLSTTDGGESWTFTSLGSMELYGVHFIDENYGTAVGSSNNILRTNDGGATWNTQNPSVSGTWYEAYFSDPITGWVAGSAGIVHTESAGAFWNLQTAGDFRALHFIDQNTAWAVGLNGLVKQTSNGGQIWNDVSFAENFQLTDIHFRSADEGWISGSGGSAARCVVYHTTNGGDSWSLDTLQSTGTSGAGYSVFAAGPGIAYWGGAHGMLTGTSDGGENWESLTSVTTPNSILEVFFVDTERGWASGTQGTVIHTSDGGQTWVDRSPGAPTGSGIQSLHFSPNGLEGWVVGSNGYGMRTTNGGIGWTPMELNTSSTLRGIAFNTTGFGVAVGENGVIRKSSDFGETWENVLGLPAHNYKAIRFAGESSGFVSGQPSGGFQPGTVLRFDMQGDSWCNMQNPHIVTLGRMMHTVSPDTVFLWYTEIQDRGILRSYNGGNSWQRISCPTYFDVHGIFFENGQHGMVTEKAARMMVTSDGGSTWDLIDLGGPTLSTGWAFFLDSQHGWIPGGNVNAVMGLTLGYTGTAGPPPLVEVPGQQSFVTVFPNPARGSTQSVTFQTPSSGDFSLAVYDISGRLVLESHLGELTAGTHSFPLQGEGRPYTLPSGVYLCTVLSATERIQGRFVVTR